MRWCIPIIIAAAILGAFGGYLYQKYDAQKLPDVWIDIPNIPTSGVDSRVSYSTAEALFGADIPLPDFKSFSAKVKFTKPRMKQNLGAVLGYIVSVDVENLDSSKIPEKYRKERKRQFRAGTFTLQPLEEVIYEVHFEFILIDKDGFELAKLESPKHYLYSGKNNIFQELVLKQIPVDIAKRTKKVKPRILIDKCVSCR